MHKKKQFFSSFLMVCLMIANLQAQSYQISFTGSGLSTTVDSVQVVNIARGTAMTVKSMKDLQLVSTSAEIETHLPGNGSLYIFPNPMTETSGIEFFNSGESPVSIEIFDITGKMIIFNNQSLIQGNHRFEISGLNRGIYMINLYNSDGKHTGKLISNGAHSCHPTIKYQVTTNLPGQKSVLRRSNNPVQMLYTDGERLLLKGFSGNYSRVLTLIPTQNQTVNFEFIACQDAAGKHYPVVTIGTQTWMAENLALLPSVSSSSQGSQITPLYYVYGYEGGNVTEAKATSNYQTYGVLYNWSAASIACPAGWHLPTDAEWKTLEMHLGMSQAKADATGRRGTNEGGKLKETGTTHWISPNTGATNESGFSALPVGYRSLQGSFYSAGYYGNWWSASEFISSLAWYRDLGCSYSGVFRDYGSKGGGLSVRCLRDN